MSVWLPSAPCTPPACLTDPVATVAGPCRAARYLAGLGVLLCGIVLAPLVGRCAPARRDRLTARWSRALVAAFGVRVRISGGDGARTAAGALVVANHVSWLDIPLIAAARPGRMLAKSEIGHYPVLGRVAARGGTLFVERDRLRALPATVAGMAALLRSGSTVVAFPEGSTWCGREHGRFRHAVFQAAIDASAPVQPAVVRYRLRDARPTAVPAFVGEDTLLASLRRVAAARGLVAELVLLPRIPAGAYPDRRALARAAEAAISGHGAATAATGEAWDVPSGPHAHGVQAQGIPARAPAHSVHAHGGGAPGDDGHGVRAYGDGAPGGHGHGDRSRADGAHGDGAHSDGAQGAGAHGVRGYREGADGTPGDHAQGDHSAPVLPGPAHPVASGGITCRRPLLSGVRPDSARPPEPLRSDGPKRRSIPCRI
ncbi:lysophospholipid acyltransferase family protein [Streptomyces sp. 8N706]|uniref:lysophospholipid acyltransferase family protein n=1 Tax=Streptomyces sp. 8N706 TaxID=3457416 RepID=UPI003FD46134